MKTGDSCKVEFSLDCKYSLNMGNTLVCFCTGDNEYKPVQWEWSMITCFSLIIDEELSYSSQVYLRRSELRTDQDWEESTQVSRNARARTGALCGTCEELNIFSYVHVDKWTLQGASKSWYPKKCTTDCKFTRFHGSLYNHASLQKSLTCSPTTTWIHTFTAKSISVSTYHLAAFAAPSLSAHEVFYYALASVHWSCDSAAALASSWLDSPCSH